MNAESQQSAPQGAHQPHGEGLDCVNGKSLAARAPEAAKDGHDGEFLADVKMRCAGYADSAQDEGNETDQVEESAEILHGATEPALSAFNRVGSQIAVAKLLLAVFDQLVGLVHALPFGVGDLDEDGRASSRDIVLLVNHLTGDVPLAPELVPFADVNQDGIVNSTDVDRLAQAVVGLAELGELPLTTIRSTSPASGVSRPASSRRSASS